MKVDRMTGFDFTNTQSLQGLELAEAVRHAKAIKYLDCKICGRSFHILFEVVFMLRHEGYCSNCYLARKS